MCIMLGDDWAELDNKFKAYISKAKRQNLSAKYSVCNEEFKTANWIYQIRISRASASWSASQLKLHDEITEKTIYNSSALRSP